jgi:mannonate dehydratase
MRWFGSDDTVRLQDIAQIPVVRGIVGTIENLSGDIVWPVDRVSALKSQVEEVGFSLEVIESIPVPEAIKQGTDDRDVLIKIYSESIRNLGQAGVRVLCYNFMPVFDWMRTDLSTRLADGSLVTSYDHQQILDYDLSRGLEERVAWGRSFTGQELQVALAEYRDIDEEILFKNLIYFLERVIPVAEQAGVLLALHPDDPPWSIFGLPRIVRDQTTIQRILEAVDSPNNGLTFCTGSLGAAPENDLPAMVRHFADRINFVHLRSVRVTGERTFQEVAHTDDSAQLDLTAVVEALVDIGYAGPMRPDHGRMIWGETGRTGYGLYDRALATMYLYGLWQGIRQQKGLAGHRSASKY